jgi:hypothetical protein
MAVDLITESSATAGQRWLLISFKIWMILKCVTCILVHETEYHLCMYYFVHFSLI